MVYTAKSSTCEEEKKISQNSLFSSSHFDDFASINIRNAFSTCKLVICNDNFCYPKQTWRFPFNRKETNTNIESFRENLLKEEWTDVLNEQNVNNAYKHLNGKL